jgi:hypothetical protein
MNLEICFMRYFHKIMKIPIKIIQVETKGKLKNVVILHSSDYFELKGDSTSKIKEFEKLYSDTVEKIKKIFYGTDGNEKKYQNLPSSMYFELGGILQKFDQKADNEFEIKNYNNSISRDFGLSKDYIYDLITIADLFKKKEILDSVPFSYYRALKRKRKDLESLGLFEKEKKRLNKMGIEDKLPGREQYKVELIKTIDSKNKEKKK